MIRFASFISLSYLLSPLVLINQRCLLRMEACSGCIDDVWTAHIHIRLVDVCCSRLLHGVGHLEALLMALEHIVGLLVVELAKAIHNLVLAWQVYLIKSLLHLRLHLHILLVDLLDSLVFRINKEFEVLTLILKLAQGLLPLELLCISLLLGLDNVEVQLVVLLGELLILLLQR